MAKIVTITNPLTGQPAQVDQLDRTAQQIDDSVARVLLSGIGSVVSTIGNNADLNDYHTATGFWGSTNTATVHTWKNKPENWISNEAILAVYVISTSYVIQELYECQNRIAARRVLRGTKWSQWEYLNPFMNIDVEYRTTDRYRGKPVYAKLVDFGLLPNNTTKDVSAGISSSDLLYGFIDLEKSYIGPESANGTNFLPMHDNITRLWFRLGDIRITTNYDMSGYIAHICVKYTKRND